MLTFRAIKADSGSGGEKGTTVTTLPFCASSDPGVFALKAVQNVLGVLQTGVWDGATRAALRRYTLERCPAFEASIEAQGHPSNWSCTQELGGLFDATGDPEHPQVLRAFYAVCFSLGDNGFEKIAFEPYAKPFLKALGFDVSSAAAAEEQFNSIVGIGRGTTRGPCYDAFLKLSYAIRDREPTARQEESTLPAGESAIPWGWVAGIGGMLLLGVLVLKG